MPRKAIWIPFVLCLAGCPALGLHGSDAPGRSIRATLDNAIHTLESGDCRGFALRFLSPIKLARIDDLEAYQRSSACTPDDQDNIDDVILALRMARLAEPESNGLVAVIDMTGIGTRPERFVLVRYTDKRWYFNQL